MAFHTGKPAYRSNPSSQEVRESLAWLKGFVDYLANSGITQADLTALHGLVTRLSTIGSISARAYRNAGLTVASGWSKVPIDTVSFDPESVIDVAINNRIVPNVAGYYSVTAEITLDTLPNGYRACCAIYKNGRRLKYGTLVPNGGAAAPVSVAADLVYMNGTTDYLELFVYHNYTSSISFYAGSDTNHLSVLGPF